jgi:uncharacterized protein DUF3185
MRMMLGWVFGLLGVVLVIHGLGAFDSAASGVSGLISGGSTDRTVWLLLGGVAAVLVGVTVAGTHPHHHRTQH